MFKKVLIANRGEIALRIIAACKELGIHTVAVHSVADRDSLHVRAADESVCIGPPSPSGSYLNITSLVAAAEITGADAVHPGYGFLAENAHFAEILHEVGLTWIGPSPDAIRKMGDKSIAKDTVKKVGVPTVPGSPGPLDSVEDAMNIAERMGYPVLLKAVAGGGGRGMRVARNDKELAAAFELATTEAERAFGNGSVYLEKYLAEPRHIEIQVFGDRFGNVVHLGERECSLQRRHQKIMEEAPSPALTDELRTQMGEAAVAAARAVEYVGAGTIEFLLDQDESFYFMEMNTRIQVEHPVTEMVTGVDLVKEQIRVAGGEPLSFITRTGRKKAEPSFARLGHAIEFRINAEDPVTFAPSPGMITAFHTPGGPGVRVDTAAYHGWVIPPYYDSLIAKLIVHGRDREEALARGRRALELFVVEGVKTTIPLHLKLLQEPDVRTGRVSTKWLERWLDAQKPGKPA
ncbi:MAG: acetyl-CoA carboxylase biotin carboxylase subunit [Acidobacteria bacterium]|nr:acetyl-CoA carboxylase biotin carboxylase subunit [Acidobacteriota bacterium]MCK6682417.1 acetyl-CoA carboxylase biotin carboxylase subunit [Thermoanaerobaculia bacterium]